MRAVAVFCFRTHRAARTRARVMRDATFLLCSRKQGSPRARDRKTAHERRVVPRNFMRAIESVYRGRCDNFGVVERAVLALGRLGLGARRRLVPKDCTRRAGPLSARADSPPSRSLPLTFG